MERRRFLILEHPIAGEDVSKLLGRLTLDFKHPMDASEPADPSAVVEPFLQPPIREAAARMFASASQDRKLRTALEPFVNVSNGVNVGAETSLGTSLIETHRLRDHNKVFHRLIDKYSKDISGMLSNGSTKFGIVPQKLYMVIGFKCLLDPSRSVKVSSGRRDSATAEFPIGAATNAVSPGESRVVFAIEYKVYKTPTLLSLFRRKNLPWGFASYRTLHLTPSQASQIAGEGDEESLGSDDEHSEESEEEESMDEEFYEGGYICRLGLDEFYVPHRV